MVIKRIVKRIYIIIYGAREPTERKIVHSFIRLNVIIIQSKAEKFSNNRKVFLS